MILKIKYNDNGYYITVDDERITDYTKFKPKKDAIIKIICPLSTLKADLHKLFLEGTFEFVDSPYMSDIFIFDKDKDIEYFMLAVLKKDLTSKKEVTNDK
jgi:hypothetical protein